MAWTKCARCGKSKCACNSKQKGCWRDHTGKVRTKTLPTKSAALKYAKKMEVEKDQGVRRDAEAERQRLGDFLLKGWLANKHNIRPNTRRIYENDIRQHILPSRLAKMALGDIKPEHVEAWITERVRVGASPDAVERAYRTLVRGLYRAVNRQTIPTNPAIRLSDNLPEKRKKDKYQLTRWEIDRVADLMRPSWYRLPFLVHAWVGVRAGEVRALTLGDVDWDQGCLWVNKQLDQDDMWAPPKNDNRDKTPAFIPEWLLEGLQEHVEDGRFTIKYTASGCRICPGKCKHDGATLLFSSGYPGAREGGTPWEKYGVQDIVAFVGKGTQQDAADKLGVAQTAISTWLRVAKGELRNTYDRPASRKYRKVNPNDLKRTAISEGGFWNAYKNALHRAELPRSSRLHDLRGSLISYMIVELGMAIDLVAAQVGDDPATLYKSYSQVRPDVQRAAIRAMPSPQALRPILRPVAALPAPREAE